MGKEAVEASIRAEHVYQVGSQITKLDLLDICFGDQTDELSRTEVAQAAISAASLAEYLYLEELGFRPDVGLGHSMGEIPLLAMAEVISVEGMFKLIKARGDATAKASKDRPGTMAALRGMSIEDAEHILGEFFTTQRLGIRNLNSNLQHVLSGDTDLIRSARDKIRLLAQSVPELKNVKLSPLKVPGAFHSPYHMGPARRRFRNAAKKIDYSPPAFELMLNDGQYLNELGVSNLSSYLPGQLVGRVLFTKAVRRLIDDGVTNFLQVGDRPVLSNLVLEDYDGQVNIIKILKASSNHSGETTES